MSSGLSPFHDRHEVIPQCQVTPGRKWAGFARSHLYCGCVGHRSSGPDKCSSGRRCQYAASRWRPFNPHHWIARVWTSWRRPFQRHNWIAHDRSSCRRPLQRHHRIARALALRSFRLLGTNVGTTLTNLPGGAASRTNLRSPIARLTKARQPPKSAPGKSSTTNLPPSPVLFSTNQPVPSTNHGAFNNGFQP